MMSRNRDSRHDGKPDDMGVEGGRIWFGRHQKPGAAGSSPGKRGGTSSSEGGKAPVKGWAGSFFGRGPTRGTSRTGRDRKGSGFFSGKYTDPYL
jgi:hypothetical protein